MQFTPLVFPFLSPPEEGIAWQIVSAFKFVWGSRSPLRTYSILQDSCERLEEGLYTAIPFPFPCRVPVPARQSRRCHTRPIRRDLHYRRPLPCLPASSRPPSALCPRAWLSSSGASSAARSAGSPSTARPAASLATLLNTAASASPSSRALLTRGHCRRRGARPVLAARSGPRQSRFRTRGRAGRPNLSRPRGSGASAIRRCQGTSRYPLRSITAPLSFRAGADTA